MAAGAATRGAGPKRSGNAGCSSRPALAVAEGDDAAELAVDRVVEEAADETGAVDLGHGLDRHVGTPQRRDPRRRVLGGERPLEQLLLRLRRAALGP